MAWLLRLSAACVAALLLVPAAAQAAQDKPRLDRTVRYLQDVQHEDGGFGERGSDPGFSFWAAMALASAGINPLDQRKKPDGTDAYTYLTRNTDGLTQSTDFARLILVASAAGRPPERVGPIDPLARMLKLQRRDGGFGQPPTRPGSQINGTAYAALALASIDRSRLEKTTRAQLVRSRDRGLDWLAGKQAADGSWGDTDLTGSVIEALNAGGRRNTPAQARALDFLRSTQNADGGFGAAPGGQSNSASTAWVVRGLVAARIQATSFQAAGTASTPLNYLASMQQTDGSVRNSATDGSNRVFITSFTSPALAGASFPIAAVEREENPKLNDSTDQAPPPSRTRGDDGGQPGAGGNADGGDGDVTSGGGGDGAPLFSQPQPGSRGQAPGGAPDTERPNPSTNPGQSEPTGESVAGRLVGQGAKLATGKNQRLGSAPGLRAAAAGGQSPSWLVTLIGVALLLSAMGGIYLERRGGKA